MQDYIDLHAHSNCSDGKKSVEDIVSMAKQNNVTVLSLSEHYNMSSYKKARALAKSSIEVIPSIEIGTSLEKFGLSKNHVCHLIAYYPSYSICKILDKYESSREVCVKKTLKKLQNYVPLSYKSVVRHARDKKSIGRFDIAIALYKEGYCPDPLSAYGEYLDSGKACFVVREKEDPVTLIREILSVGGVPTLVHPKSLKLNYSDLYDFIKKLKDAGLEGLEVFNPHHNKEQLSVFDAIAKDLDLVSTVGSDYHGIVNQDIEIGKGINGNLCINDYDIITELKRKKHDICLK